MPDENDEPEARMDPHQDLALLVPVPFVFLEQGQALCLNRRKRKVAAG